MYRIPKFFGIHAEPSGSLQKLLGVIPFVLIILVYSHISQQRIAKNPDERITPSISSMVERMGQVAFYPDKYTGTYVLLNDTKASLKRIFVGMFVATAVGLILGLNMGIFPGLEAMLLPIVTFLSNIPTLALLTILMIALGTDDLSKMTMIFLGEVFVITRAIYIATKQFPRQLIVQTLTLGGSQLEVVYSTILPYLQPVLINAVRLALGAAWLYVIAFENVGTSEGLGHRIYISKRNNSMDIIIPYVLWITFLAYAMDWLLKKANTWMHPWYTVSKS